MSTTPTQTRCGELNPERTHMCDLPAGHDGDHCGPILPMVVIDDPTWEVAR